MRPDYHAGLRKLAIALIAALVCAVALAATVTPQGRAVMHDPASFAATVRDFAAAHPLLALVAIVGVYLLMSLALMWVWWLQVLAGCAFGLYAGTALCCACSAASATLIVATSRSLGASDLRAVAEGRLARLRAVMDRMGRNGLATVLALRLAHLVPFSLSNFLLSLTPVRKRDVFIGTFVGNLPSIAFYVALGAAPQLVKTWGFWAVVVGINVALLLPLAARYLARRGLPPPPPPGV